MIQKMTCDAAIIVQWNEQKKYSVVNVIDALHGFIVHWIIPIILHGAVCYGMRGRLVDEEGGCLPFIIIIIICNNYHNYDIYIFFLLCEKVFEIDILFLPFTISMQCLLLIKTYVDVLVFCNVLSLQLVFWHRLLTLGLQGSECVIWAKALQSEHNLCRVIWVAENTLNPQLLEKVPKYYLCSSGQSFKLYLAQQLIL